MHFVRKNGRRYAQFEGLGDAPGLTHAYSTRPDDVSARRDAKQDERAARRRRMAADFELDPQRIHCCVQIHDTHIAVVDESSETATLEDTDGAITVAVGLPLMTFSADCPLVLLYDPTKHVLGMVHASWRCTVARAAARLVGEMIKRSGARPGDILAGIGPSAGECCYEVKQDVVDAVADSPEARDSFVQRDGRMYFDLWRANRLQLRNAGLRDENIETGGICTMCRNDIFYSYRREGRGCGHFGLMAALNEAC